jgi:replicative DNA helicase
MVADATSVINLYEYSTLVQALATLRSIQVVAEDITIAGQDIASIQETVRRVFDDLDAVRASGIRWNRQTTFTIGDAAAAAVEQMSARMQGQSLGGTPTHLADLDRVIGGFSRGDLIIIGGRPGMGKTTLAAAIARAVAVRPDGDTDYGLPVAYFSLEMPITQITPRIISDHAYGRFGEIEFRDIINANAETSNATADIMVNAARDLERYPLIVDDASRLTVGELASKVRSINAVVTKKWGKPLSLVVVDYMKMLQASSRYFGNRVYEVGEITAGLKGIAREQNCAVVLLAQLSRGVEQRDDKRPILSDLRESGDIEADADVVLFTYREAYYLANHPNIGTDQVLQSKFAEYQNLLEILVAKQRQGPVGVAVTWCNMAAGAIRDRARVWETAQQRPLLAPGEQEAVL